MNKNGIEDEKKSVFPDILLSKTKKNDIIKEKAFKEGSHPATEIVKETMELIKSGNLSEVLQLSEEEENTFGVLKNAVKKMDYKITKVEEDNEITTLSIRMKIPNLSGAKDKLSKILESMQSKIKDKTELELENLSLKYLNQIVDEIIDSKDLNYDIKNITVKYRKDGEEWIVEDDSEFIEIFNFKMEEEK